jgi:hypothetical protein
MHCSADTKFFQKLGPDNATVIQSIDYYEVRSMKVVK